MSTIKVRCPNCKREKNFLPMKTNKEAWSTECFFCGKKFKIFPKRGMSRIVER